MNDIDPAPAHAAPTSLEEAAALFGHFSRLSAKRDRVEAQRQARLAPVNAAADAVLAPIVDELAQLVALLQPWWDANRAQILPPKKKSAEIGGCQVGNRLGNARVVFGGDDATAIAAIRTLRGARALLKVSTSLDRPAILRQLGADTAATAQLKALGFAVRQDETFFITPLPSAPLGQPARATRAAA